MSFQYLEFSCSKCSLTDSDISYFGPMVYQAPDGPIPVERQLGWCKHCKGIVPIEILPSPQRIEKIRSRTYPKLWGEPAPDTVVTAEEAARESEYQQHCRSRDIADEKLRLAYMKLRISSPRCLRCGSKRCPAYRQTNHLGKRYSATTRQHQLAYGTLSAVGSC